jgi:hypothetical protein
LRPSRKAGSVLFLKEKKPVALTPMLAGRGGADNKSLFASFSSEKEDAYFLNRS